MAALKLVAVAIALLGASRADAGEVAVWRPFITEASLRYGIPSAWIEQVMHAESGGRTMLYGRPIRSRAGAMGLMQLMPATWESMRRTLRLGSNPDDPRDNILAGTFYLRLMYERFGYPGLFAAYNAGPARYAGHLASGRRLPGETVAYLRTVGGALESDQPVARAVADTLFAIRREGTAQPSSSPRDRPSSSLFAVEDEGNSR